MTSRRTEKILLRGVISKGVNMAVQFGYALILTPVLLVHWGAAEYGVWLALMSVYGLLMSLDIGHGTYIGTEFNKQFNLEEGGGKEILGSALKAQYFSGFIQLLIVLALVWFDLLDWLIKTDIMLKEVGICLLLLVSYRFLLGSARSVLIRIVYPLGYLDRMTYLYSAERLLELIAVIVVASLGYSIVVACAILVGIRVVMTFVVAYSIWQLMPDYFPWWASGDTKTGLRNYIVSLTMAGSTLVDKLNTDGINLVISAFLGVELVAIYVTIRTLSNVVIQSVQLIAEPLLPEMTRYLVLREYHKLAGMIKSYWLSACALCCLGLIISLTCIKPLYDLWVRDEIQFDNDLYGVMIMAVAAVAFGRVLVVLIKSSNDLRSILTLAVVRAILVLGISFLLVNRFELIGIAIAVLISELVASGILPVRIVGQRFSRGGYNVKPEDVLPALIPVVIAVISILMWMTGMIPIWLNVTLASIVVIIAMIYQWKYLSPEVKVKLKGVLS